MLSVLADGHLELFIWGGNMCAPAPGDTESQGIR